MTITGNKLELNLHLINENYKSFYLLTINILIISTQLHENGFKKVELFLLL
jgi:hypothetical protein